MSDYIEEVKKLHLELDKVSRQDNCYYDFRSIVRKMLEIIPTATREVPFLVNTYELANTLNHEVEDIKWYQDLKNKKNAPKKRTDDYWNAVKNAKGLIELNIFSIIHG